jgi:hypothetical protein
VMKFTRIRSIRSRWVRCLHQGALHPGRGRCWTRRPVN